MKVYIREIVVFRSFAEVYTRKILQIFELAKLCTNEVCFRLVNFVSTFSALFTTDENEYFVFVNNVSLL